MKNLGRSLKNPKSSPFKLYYFLNKILSKMYIFQSILYYPPRGPKITLVNPPLNKGPPAKHYYILLYCCVLLYTTAHYCVLLCTTAYYCVLLCTTVYYRVLLHTTVSCTCQYYCVLLHATESYRVLLFADYVLLTVYYCVLLCTTVYYCVLRCTTVCYCALLCTVYYCALRVPLSTTKVRNARTRAGKNIEPKK